MWVVVKGRYLVTFLPCVLRKLIIVSVILTYVNYKNVQGLVQCHIFA